MTRPDPFEIFRNTRIIKKREEEYRRKARRRSSRRRRTMREENAESPYRVEDHFSPH